MEVRRKEICGEGRKEKSGRDHGKRGEKGKMNSREQEEM